jgi:hypothetical protein
VANGRGRGAAALRQDRQHESATGGRGGEVRFSAGWNWRTQVKRRPVFRTW